MGEESFQLVLTNTDVFQDIAAPVEIEWWFQEESQTYYLFLPSHFEKGLYYVFNLYDYVLINDNRVEPGDRFELDNGRYILQVPDGSEITLEVMHSRHLASMFIQTDSRNLAYIQETKQNVDSGQYTLIDKEGNKSSSGKIEKFHCRGNMTFDAADKKSYAIKLKDKTGILNLGIEKDWLLLANAFDETLSRNGIAAEITGIMGMEYAPEICTVTCQRFNLVIRRHRTHDCLKVKFISAARSPASSKQHDRPASFKQAFDKVSSSPFKIIKARNHNDISLQKNRRFRHCILRKPYIVWHARCSHQITLFHHKATVSASRSTHKVSIKKPLFINNKCRRRTP